MTSRHPPNRAPNHTTYESAPPARTGSLWNLSVWTKLWLYVSVFLMLICGAWFAISRITVQREFHQYADATLHEEASEWADLLGSYYASHGTWTGASASLHAYVQRQHAAGEGVGLYRIVLKTLHGTTLETMNFGSPPSDRDDAYSVSVPVIVADKPVAEAVVSDTDIEGLEALERQAVHSMATTTVWVLLLTIAISIGLAALMARRMTIPLRTMMAGARRLAAGDLKHRMHVQSNDEFEQLARTLNDMSAQLNEAIDARSRLVADVAHELRTPVSIMQAQLDLIEDGLQPAEPASLSPVQDEVLRLSTLIDELHELVLAESHQLTLHLQTLDLVAWLGDLADRFVPEASDKAIDLSFHSELPHAYVDADPHRLTHVFSNLIRNAIRYTPSPGEVMIKVTSASMPGHVQVSVSDSGPGIPVAQQPYIFQRFYRLEAGRSRQTGGMGLGLAIAKELVELHDGQIAVKDRGGGGSTFTVLLPVTARKQDD